jgi:GntP family gluconate:H+ symporter
VAAQWTRVVGNPGFALLVAAVIALVLMQRQGGLTRLQVAEAVEESLASGGVIILITAAGGAFGAMLQQAGLGDALQKSASLDSHSTGVTLALGGFGVASLLKLAQGSSTVAMIGASAVLGALQPGPGMLGFHPAYLATAIGCGSLVGSWMNDSGFWIYSRMGGFTEAETLKTWTPGLAIVGLVGMAVTLALSAILPLD